MTRDALHVTRDTQDISAKKQQQGTKMQELEHKLASVAQVEISLELILIMYTALLILLQNRETLERTVYNIRDEVSSRSRATPA